MRPEDVRDFVRRQPFQPFKITLTDGRTYEVHHPELAMVGWSTVAIGLRKPDVADPIYDRLITVSLIHIMQIQPLEASPSPPSEK